MSFHHKVILQPDASDRQGTAGIYGGMIRAVLYTRAAERYMYVSRELVFCFSASSFYDKFGIVIPVEFHVCRNTFAGFIVF